MIYLAALNLAVAALYTTRGEWDVVATLTLLAILAGWLERKMRCQKELFRCKLGEI